MRRRRAVQIRRAVILGSLLSILALAPGSRAAVPVVEVGANLIASQLSAVNDTITAAQSVIMVANWAIDLSPIEEMVMAGNALEDLVALTDLIREAEGLSWDIQGIAADFDRWFAPHNEPSSSKQWWVRQSDFQHVVRQGYLYAM